MLGHRDNNPRQKYDIVIKKEYPFSINYIKVRKDILFLFLKIRYFLNPNEDENRDGDSNESSDEQKKMLVVSYGRDSNFHSLTTNTLKKSLETAPTHSAIPL